MNRKAIFFLILAVPAYSQVLPDLLASSFQSAQAAPEDPEYQKGLKQLDAREWDEAISSFDASAAHNTRNADASLYWKAYAQNRSGRYNDALSSISRLQQLYSSSKWVKDAQALAVEVRAQKGDPVSPGTEQDDDLKLIAVNSLMQANPDQALPILQKLVTGNNSDKVKERALFVLTQNSSPQARKLLVDMARNSANPDLQLKAIRYMGLMGNADARNGLASIYNASSDVRLKRAILKSFMQSGSRDLLVNVAKTEQNPELRRDAIRQLAITGGQEELWQLYQSSNSIEDKKDILHAMFLTGNSTRLVEIARSEKDSNLRIAAIDSLGKMGGNGSSDVLVSIYRNDNNREVREAVLQALFIQQNGKALVDLARSEKDPEMKQQIVKKMSLVQSKEVTEYMMDILK
jgi:HEAT repeat protein